MHEFTAYIVDDDEFIVRALQRTLKRLVPHWQIHYFVDPSALIAQLPNITDAQLVISDRMMPVVQGEAVLGAVKQYLPAAIRVLLTADTSAEVVVQDCSLIHHFLAKPFTDADFVRVFQCAERLATLPMEQKTRKTLGSMSELPILPAHFYQLQQLCQDPSSELNQLGLVVGRDPVLVGRILQLANSPFMGYSRATNAIDEALLRLGFDLVLGLAANLYSHQQMADRVTEQVHQQILTQAWQQATIAKVLARQSELSPKLQDLIFMGALLCALGQLVLVAQPNAFANAEKPATDFWPSGDLVTAYLLTLWGFEPALSHAVLTQQQLRDLPDDSSLIAACLHCSRVLWQRLTSRDTTQVPPQVPKILCREFELLWQQAESGQLRALW